MTKNVLALLAGLLCACTTTPALDTRGVTGPATPMQALSHPEDAVGRIVHWGGEIVQIANLSEVTELHVIARPLRGDGRPKSDKESLGRFLVAHHGFLEPYDYAPGRFVSAVGRVKEFRRDADDVPVPVVQVEQLRLWPRRDTSRPAIGIGIGIGIGF